MSTKRKLHEYIAELNLNESKKIKCTELCARRSVASQTEDVNVKYSKTEVDEIIKITKNEMLSKYYDFIKKSNLVEKVIHLGKCEI